MNLRMWYRDRYAENAAKLESVLCLMEKFERYQDVPKVAAFRDMVDLISKNLHQQIIREFQLLWIVSDPFVGRFSVSENSSYEDKQQLRTEQEQVSDTGKLVQEQINETPQIVDIVTAGSLYLVHECPPVMV